MKLVNRLLTHKNKQKLLKKEKWKVNRGDRRDKTGENKEDFLFCDEVLT